MFRYDCGKLFWACGPRKDREAGGLDDRGYWRIYVHSQRLRRAHIVWSMFRGKLVGQIDHINGVRSDDRIENLRDVPISGNQQNKRAAQANSHTGLLGVSSRGGRYMARIKVSGRHVYLGTYDTAQLASDAYLAAKKEMHPWFVAVP